MTSDVAEAEPAIARVVAELEAARPGERTAAWRAWRGVSEVWRGHPEWRPQVAEHARRDGEFGKFARFALASHAAGLGELSRIGPAALRETSLGWYLTMQASIRVPDDSPRRLEWSEAVGALKVTIAPPPASDDARPFQEILWLVVERYNLHFELTKDNALRLSRP